MFPTETLSTLTTILNGCAGNTSTAVETLLFNCPSRGSTHKFSNSRPQKGPHTISPKKPKTIVTTRDNTIPEGSPIPQTNELFLQDDASSYFFYLLRHIKFTVSVEEDIYRLERKQAFIHLKKRDRYFRQAAMAYDQEDHSSAQYLATLGHQENKLFTEESRLAANRIFKSRYHTHSTAFSVLETNTTPY